MPEREDMIRAGDPAAYTSVESTDDPNWGLPPEPEHWPTAEELREAEAMEADPRDELRELRRQFPTEPLFPGLRMRPW